MSRMLFSIAFFFVLCGFACTACAKRPAEIFDPTEAAKDPDFKIQGEYVGQGTWADGADAKAGAQVIAMNTGTVGVGTGLTADNAGGIQEFDALRIKGEQMGFTHVASGPMVRSSYHADLQARGALAGDTDQK